MFQLHTIFYLLFIDCRHQTEGLLITSHSTNKLPEQSLHIFGKSITMHWRQSEVMLLPHNFARPLGYYGCRKLKFKRSSLRLKILVPTSSSFSGLHAELCSSLSSGPNHIETLRIAVIYSTLHSLPQLPPINPTPRLHLRVLWIHMLLYLGSCGRR
jgi:hypothetical protein